MKSIVLMLGAALAGASLSSACAQSPDADALLEEIREIDRIPGVMAAVVRDGAIIWSGAAGFADLESRTALTTRTRMRIGSVSKPLTAALALRLAQDGRLDIDGDIRNLVPELAEPEAGVITARRIAGHTSGIRQYDFTSIEDANNFMFYPALDAALARVAGDPLVHVPGTDFHYSSIAFNVLGVAAERAAGRSFDAAMTEEITRPLGLHDTLIDHPLEIIERRTRFYTLFPDGVVRNTIWRDSSDYYPSGGMLSTAEDLARFAHAVFAGDLIDPAMQEVLRTEITTSAGEGSGYAFGWQVVRDETGRVTHYEHGGETNGAYAYIRFDPDSGLALAMIGNANHAVGEPVFFEYASERLPALFD
ncbi:serine hydrolase domain-containing protein [Hyphobacterium sp.]|jgi:CubicO group peptidase (beta-lactamase class C family)|uniref:serine hydrolase domain-containing protein n=1 Tax=Hyphobacterium sp. TaxID=2004662 RepID=UPI003BAD564C